MQRDRLHFAFLNAGHFIDHLATLVFATVAALALSREWSMSYAELVPYATPGFIAFGLFALPAGWLGDRWSRDGMIAVFFVGIGLASIATAFADSPVQLGVGLFVTGMFAAIYHPVGIALVMGKYPKAGMALAINGVWGNLGVACAALLTGFLIDLAGWRAAFAVPGVVSVAIGMAYTYLFWPQINAPSPRQAAATIGAGADRPASKASDRGEMIRAAVLVFAVISLSSFIFQSTTFAIPKVFEERLGGIGSSATAIGGLAFVVFALASLSQLAVGRVLDSWGPRRTLMLAAGVECGFLAVMPGLADWPALIVALAFMAAAFGQIPATDYIVGKLARSESRSLAYGLRYVVSFGVAASTVPIVAAVHALWGFDGLFQILAIAAGLIFLGVAGLPSRLGSEPSGLEAARG